MIQTSAAIGARGGPRRPMPAEVRAPRALVRAILEGGKARPGRLWFLLQVADPAGRGGVGLDRAQALASGPDDLGAGAGLFWEIDQGGARLRLRSPARVGQWLEGPPAARRGCPRRRPAWVALPVGELMAGPDRAAVAMWAAVERSLSPAERAVFVGGNGSYAGGVNPSLAEV